MSDNYHQAVLGGTGANHIMLGSGDAIWFSGGNPPPPPPPFPPPTNNFYTQDGYGGGSGSPTATAPKANYGGGSYVACADNPSRASRRLPTISGP